MKNHSMISLGWIIQVCAAAAAAAVLDSGLRYHGFSRVRRLLAAAVLLLCAILLRTVVLPFRAEVFWAWTAAAALTLPAGARWRSRAWFLLDSCALSGLAATGVASVCWSLLENAPSLQTFRMAAFLAWAAAGGFVFSEARQTRLLQRPAGLVLGETSILAGAICGFYAFSSADPPAGWAGFATALAGAVLVALRVTSFLRGREEHRIIEQQKQRGMEMQPEYTGPSPECREPQRWSMYDPMTAEVEVLDLLQSLVRAVKPELVLETGTFTGVSSLLIAEALQQTGRGRLLTCEMDPKVHQAAVERFKTSPAGSLIDCRCCASLDLQVDGPIDMLYCDSDLAVRESEVRHFLPKVNPFGLILMHDAGSHFQVVREGAFRMEREGLISVIAVSTPRGLVIAQKREGRN